MGGWNICVKNKPVIAIVALLIVIFAIVSSGFGTGSNPFISLPSAPVPKAAIRALVANETFRLESLSQTRNLTVADLQPLKLLVIQDIEFADSFAELDWMVVHNYPMHVIHSLAAVNGVALNQSLLCPADDMSHVGIYLSANDTAMVALAINGTRDDVDAWAAQVAAKKSASPSSYAGADILISRMRQELSDYDRGDYQATIADAKFVENNLIC